MHWRRKWQPTPVFLPGESQGRGSPVGYCLGGCMRRLSLALSAAAPDLGCGVTPLGHCPLGMGSSWHGPPWHVVWVSLDSLPPPLVDEGLVGPSKEIPGLISFRMDWLDLLAVQGTLNSLLQHHSSKASFLWAHPGCGCCSLECVEHKTRAGKAGRRGGLGLFHDILLFLWLLLKYLSFSTN